MKELNIDLGSKGSESYPEMPHPSDKEYYPTLHISTDEELSLPRSGKLVIQFRKVRSEETENEEGETRYSCTLEVIALDSVEGSKEKSKQPDEEFDERMDHYRKSKGEKE